MVSLPCASGELLVGEVIYINKSSHLISLVLHKFNVVITDEDRKEFMNNFPAEIFFFKLHQSKSVFNRKKKFASFFDEIIVKIIRMDEINTAETQFTYQKISRNNAMAAQASVRK